MTSRDYPWRGMAVVLLVLFALAGFLLAEREPDVSLSAVQDGSELKLRVETRRVNGLLGIRLAEGSGALWDVDLQYWPGPEIVYGRVPSPFVTLNGNSGKARQVFPEADGAPSPLRSGTEVLVEVDYQYDRWISACAGRKRFALRLEESGAVRVEER